MMAAGDFFAVVISLMLALIFISACRHKIVEWPRFKAAFAAYRLMPEGLVTAAAIVVSGAEMLVIVGLMTLRPEASFAAAGLLGIYLLAIAINLFRGRRHIDCGCGDEPTPLSYRLVLRNGLLIGLAFFAGVNGADFHGVTWQFGLMAVLTAGVGFGIYMVVEQLIANRGRHARLWLGA